MKEKNTLITILLLATLIFFSGCNKEKDNLSSGKENEIRLVSSITQYGNNDEGEATFTRTEYSYDNLNRITEMTSIAEGITSRLFYSYPEENIMLLETSDLLYSSITYILNDDGSISSYSNGDKIMEVCTYSNGFLQKKETDIGFESSQSKSIENFTWENGTITSAEVISHAQLIFTYTLTYEYGEIENKLCSIDFYLTDFISPRGWYGKSIPYMPSKITFHSDLNGSGQSVSTYRYEIDEKGYITKIFVKLNDNNEELRTIIEYAD